MELSQRARVRAGDHDEFGVLFEEHARAVYNHARRQQAAMSRLPKAQDVPDFADDLAGRLDDAERLEKIHAALHGLRHTERDVLALCVWSGLNYAEAAEALGVPVGTVRSRLSRTRRKLQRKLQREPSPASEQVTGDRVGGTR